MSGTELRLSEMEIIIGDVVKGSVINVCERPSSVEEVRETIITVIEEIQDIFGYDLQILPSQYKNKIPKHLEQHAGALDILAIAKSQESVNMKQGVLQ